MNSDGDLMDWQLEDEFVIPQPNDMVYTYGLPVAPEVGPGSAGNGAMEFRFGASASVRQKAASSVGVCEHANRSNFSAD